MGTVTQQVSFDEIKHVVRLLQDPNTLDQHYDMQAHYLRKLNLNPAILEVMNEEELDAALRKNFPGGFTTVEVYDEEATEKEEAEVAKKSKRKKGKGFIRKARRVARSPETWRVLANYPLYEVSSHHRCRCIDRANPADVLKPRSRWISGYLVSYYKIRDEAGKTCERHIGHLLVRAGFLPEPAWFGRRKAGQTEKH